MRKSRILTLFLALAVVFTMSFAAVPAYAASGTAITSADDLKAMENNPSGSYYLANDIEVPANLSLFTDSRTPFTGTLDGNGHSIKGYSYTAASDDLMHAALFCRTKNASFKDLNMTDIHISVKSGGNFAALAAYGQGTTFENITVSGKLSASGIVNSLGGIVGSLDDGSITNCTNKADITVTGAAGAAAAGVAGTASATTVKNCTNSGAISISGPIDGGRSYRAAGVTNAAGKVISCKNTGAVSVTTRGSVEGAVSLSAAGVVGTSTEQITSCANTGKITMKSTVEVSRSILMGGVAANAENAKITKSWNKGAVTFNGVAEYGAVVGGLGAITSNISQSWNKGAVSAKASKNELDVVTGGLAGTAVDMRNSYNTGSVTLSGGGYVGGLAGNAGGFDHRITNNYSTGTVKGSKGATKGQLIGIYSEGDDKASNKIYNNYYTKSGKAYGFGSVAKKSWAAKSQKVASIKAGNCPKLSSKYWTYSSKYGRMILKNNKEK